MFNRPLIIEQLLMIVITEKDFNRLTRGMRSLMQTWHSQLNLLRPGPNRIDTGEADCGFTETENKDRSYVSDSRVEIKRKEQPTKTSNRKTPAVTWRGGKHKTLTRSIQAAKVCPVKAQPPKKQILTQQRQSWEGERRLCTSSSPHQAIHPAWPEGEDSRATI